MLFKGELVLILGGLNSGILLYMYIVLKNSCFEYTIGYYI